jgi:fibronectin type 3 domain-containing protein
MGKTAAAGLIVVLLLLSLNADFQAGTGTASSGDAVNSTAGSGHSRFASQRDALPVCGTYRCAAICDVDHDGNPDIIAGGDNGIEAWAGDGAGSWTSKTGPTGAGKCYDIALADINHDGDADIIAAQDSGVGLWNGDGAWGWTAGTAPVTGGTYISLALGDFNIDGNEDVTAGGNGGIRVLLGNGKGGWSAGPDPVSGGTWYDTVTGDFNLDGKTDVAACGNESGTQNGSVMVFHGNGTGAWVSRAWVTSGMQGPPGAMGTTDVNRDGVADIVTAGRAGANYFMGENGGGWSQGPAPSSGSDINALIVEDLDRDGKADIAAGHDKGVSVWLGDGGTSWPAFPARPLFNMTVLGLACGDLNHDAKPDLVAATEGKGLAVWLSDVGDITVTGWTAASSGLQSAGKWADVDFGDVNNDGKLDILVTSYQNTNQGMRVFLGNGSGGWTNSSTGLPLNTSLGGGRFADLDHDGRLDIIASTDAGASGIIGTRVWKGNGDGTWTFSGTVDTRSGAGLEVGDVNNDGNLDAVTGFWTGSFGPMVFLGNGNLTFQPDSAPSSTLNVDDVAIGDADNDGKMDLAASSMDNKGIQFWTGNGTGAAASWTREDSGLPATAVYLGLAMADVNNDGSPDLAAAGYGPGNGVHVYLGDGGAGGSLDWTESSAGLPTAADFGGLELADLDLDGDIDLLAGNVSNGGLDLFAGNGGNGGALVWTETGKAPLPSSGNVWGVRFGDINNDGVLDIAATPDGSGAKVWRTDVSRPQNFDHVTISPSGGQLEVGNTVQYTTQAYDAGNNPVGGISYLWEFDTACGSIDGPSGAFINITGVAEGRGNLTVTATQGLFARGASRNIAVLAPPKPSDVVVVPKFSISPSTIWLNGANRTGIQENATINIGLKALGRNITANDSLSMNLTLAPDIEPVVGKASPAPDVMLRNPNGTAALAWNIGFIGNSSTLTFSMDIVSNMEGLSVSVIIPHLSYIRYLNLSGLQTTMIGGLSFEVRSIEMDAPGPPLNFRAVPGDGFVCLSWSPPDFDGTSSIIGYNIYRGDAEGSEDLLESLGNALAFNDTNVTNGQKYFYVLRAVNSAGEGMMSWRVNATPLAGAGPPSAPRNLTATAGNGFVALGWEPPIDNGGLEILSYSIYRGNAPGTGERIATVSGLGFNDSSVDNNLTYYYRVSAKNSIGEGPGSLEVDATPRGPPPQYAPSEPRDMAAVAGDGFVNISWRPPRSEGSGPVSNYRLLRGTVPGNGTIYKVLGPISWFNDTSVENGRKYYYSVAAVNIIGTGPAAKELEAVPWALPSSPGHMAVTIKGTGKVVCGWDPPGSNGGFPVTAYKVYRADGKGSLTFKQIGNTTVSMFNDTTVRAGMRYSYKVSAVTEKGEGTASEPAGLTVPAGKITTDSVTIYWLMAPVLAVVVCVAIAVLRAKRKRN